MKKILVMLMTLALTLFTLVGCGQESKHETTSHTTQTAASESVKDHTSQVEVKEDGTYTDKEHVAAYIHTYGHLPSNYITKKQAEALGWKDKGTLDKVAPGKSIGGDRFGNYEKQVPDQKGRTWKEADIDYAKGNRNGKRIVYSNDGLVYYSNDHYKNFEKL